MRRRTDSDGVARVDRMDRFASVSTFLAACGTSQDCSDSQTRWAGGTYEDALGYARNGDLSYVKDAERIAEKIDNALDCAGVQDVLQPSVYGFTPIVPAYLAGTPEAMLTKTEETMRGDIEIWEDLTIDYQASVEDVRRKGVVLLATVLALSKIANVHVVAYSAYCGVNPVIELTTPISVSELCAVFTQPCFLRQLVHGYCVQENHKAKNHVPDSLPFADWGTHVSGTVESEHRSIAKLAGISDDAIVFGNDRRYQRTESEIVGDINRLVAKYRERFSR